MTVTKKAPTARLVTKARKERAARKAPIVRQANAKQTSAADKALASLASLGFAEGKSQCASEAALRLCLTKGEAWKAGKDKDGNVTYTATPRAKDARHRFMTGLLGSIWARPGSNETEGACIAYAEMVLDKPASTSTASNRRTKQQDADCAMARKRWSRMLERLGLSAVDNRGKSGKGKVKPQKAAAPKVAVDGEEGAPALPKVDSPETLYVWLQQQAAAFVTRMEAINQKQMKAKTETINLGVASAVTDFREALNKALAK